MNRTKIKISVVINCLLLILVFISIINIMSINWELLPTFELYRDYKVILKLNNEELNAFFINQFKDDMLFSFVPNLILFCVLICIFILLNTKLRINRSIKNNSYRNFNLIISQTMNRILILMISISILFSYLLSLPRDYGFVFYYWYSDMFYYKLLIRKIYSNILVLNQIIIWISAGIFLIMNGFFRNNVGSIVFSYRDIRRNLP